MNDDYMPSHNYEDNTTKKISSQQTFLSTQAIDKASAVQNANQLVIAQISADSSETSIAAMTRKDISEAFTTRTQASKEEYYLSHYTHLKQLQDEDFAFALADKRMKNRLTLAAQQEQLDQFTGSKTLNDASLRIQEKRLLSDADNAHAISNAKSRDTVRTLDAPGRWHSTPRHRDYRDHNPSSRNSTNPTESSYSSRTYYGSNSRHEFSYQSEFVAFEVERKKAEHDIIMAQKKNELAAIRSSTTSHAATPGDETNQRRGSARDDVRQPQSRSRSRSPRTLRETYSSSRRQSRSRSPDRRYYEHSRSRHRSRSRSPDNGYSRSRRRSRSRSPAERYYEHHSSRRRFRSRSPASKHGAYSASHSTSEEYTASHSTRHRDATKSGQS